MGSYRANYEQYVAEAADYLKREYIGTEKPLFGVTLGSGLGALSKTMQGEHSVEISYDHIPHFPHLTADGHEGKMTIGYLGGLPVIGLSGRKHFYETVGEDGILEAVFAIHVLAELGVPNYFVTNAAGGLNRRYDVGDMMILGSHINLIPNPLQGPNMKFKRLDGTPVWRFQPMNDAYNPALRKILHKAAEPYSERVHEGVYLAVTGPNYETDAECRTFRDRFGADAVGMSTAPEVLVARNRDMKVVGFSCITNKIREDGTNATNHEEVKAVLESPEVRARFADTVERFFGLYKESLAAV